MAGLSFILMYLGWISTSAFLFDSYGVVRPVNPYAFIGDTLNLTCNVTDDSKFPGDVSESLYFVHVNGTEEIVLPSQYISVLNPRSILLAYPVTSGMDQGGYTCLFNKTSGKPEVINSQTLTVEHRPLVVKEIDTVVHDWLSMTTTWKLGQEYVNPRLVDVQLVWTIHGRDSYLCRHGNKTSCIWKEDDGRDSFKNVPYYIYINVTTYKQEGFHEKMDQSTTGWFTVNTKHLVKPAPVESLTVVDKNSTCISLSWQHSQNSKLRTLDNRVLVKHGSVVMQNVSTEERKLVVCDLMPNTVYTFNVTCIPIPIGGGEGPRGYYSDWKAIESRTMREITTLGPTTLVPSKSGVPHVSRNMNSDGELLLKTDEDILTVDERRRILEGLISIVSQERLAFDQGRLVMLQERLVMARKKLVMIQEKHVKDQERLIIDREKLVMDREKLVMDREKLAMDQVKLAMDQEKLVKDQVKLVMEQEKVVKKHEKDVLDKVRRDMKREELVKDQYRHVKDPEDWKKLVKDWEKLAKDHQRLAQTMNKLVNYRETLVSDQMGNRESLNIDCGMSTTRPNV